MVMTMCIDVDQPPDSDAVELPTQPARTLWNGTTAPVTLSAVSREWRHHALGIPRLWSELCVTLSSDTVASNKALDVLKISLARAMAAPIKLAVSVATRAGEPDTVAPAVQDHLRAILLTPCKTWECLDIYDLNFDWEDLVRRAQPGSFASLVYLRWNFQAGCPSAAACMLGASPRLRRLDIYGLRPVRPLDFGLCAEQLASLELGLDASAAEAAAVLVQCINVEHCTLDFEVHTVRDARASALSQGGPTLMRRLRVLHLVSACDPGPIFDAITAPALEALQLTNDNEDVENLADAVFSASSLSCMLARSEAKLAHLELSEVIPDDVNRLRVPSVKHVSIETNQSLCYVLGLLARCGDLETCKVSSYGEWPLGGTALLPTELKQLVGLKIDYGRFED